MNKPLFKESLQKETMQKQDSSMVAVDSHGHGIWSKMYFLARRPKYAKEKPYSMRYYPGDIVPQSNVEREEHTILFTDIRHHLDNCSLDRKGFELMLVDTSMAYEDFADNEMVRNIYIREVESTLKERLGATHVIGLDFAVSLNPRGTSSLFMLC